MTWNRTGNIRGPGGLLLPAAFVLFGHSLAANGGAQGNSLTRGWENMLVQTLRARLWNQAVGGAVLGRSNLTRGSTGWGGHVQVLQGLTPNPYTNICWRGVWSSAISYGYGDGVTYQGGWYVQEASGGSLNQVPGGANAWVLVSTTPGFATAGAEAFLSTYPGYPFVPILWFGTNDLGWAFAANDQWFLSVMESVLAQACATASYDADSTMITYANGVFAAVNSYAATNVLGTLSKFQIVPNTAGATISFTTPPDWPGGYVDFRFVSSFTIANFAFTVDGVATNVLNVGTVNSNLVDLAYQKRMMQSGTALTTALAAGVAVTSLAVNALAEQWGSGTAITVGPSGAQDTFTSSAVAAAGATSIPVTSKAPAFAHPINDPVGCSVYSGNTTVRVPTAAGSHTVTATLQASPAPANVYFDGIVLESLNPPPIIVPGLPYLPDYFAFWPSRSQGDAATDQWNTDLQALLVQFPSSRYVDTTQIGRPGAKLATALTANQAGITSLSLQAPGLPYAVSTGDTIGIGSGITRQFVTAAVPAAKGASSVSVNSFTSTYDEPVGTWVWDATVVKLNYHLDGVHYSDTGHQLVAKAMMDAINSIAAGLDTQQLVRLSSPSRSDDTYTQRYAGAGNIAVGTGTAGQWGRVGSSLGLLLSIPADPGDTIEVNLAGLWDAPSGAVAGYLDLVTWNQFSAIPINYFSGYTFGGNAGTSGLGVDAGGGGFSNGLAALLSADTTVNLYQSLVGTFSYVVQPADIIGGVVQVALWGKSSTTVQRNIIAGAGANSFIWSIRNKGPMSYIGESV